jgi:F0F1-type ATP synthase delta subunit
MMAVKEEKSVNELREFILGVPLGTDQRKTIIDAIAKDIKMQKETCDFLKLLIDTNRMDAIEDIINVFDEKYNILTDTQVRVLSQTCISCSCVPSSPSHLPCKKVSLEAVIC